MGAFALLATVARASAGDIAQIDGITSGSVFATNYDMSGGTISSTGVVTIDGKVTISGTANVEAGGWFLAADDLPSDSDGTIYPTITQNGDDSVFDGRVSSIDAYGYLEQSNYFTSYTLDAGTVGQDAYIFTGDKFDQNGGAMNGTANTWTYTLTGGTLGGTAIATDFNADGGDVQSGAEVYFIHTTTISDGTFDEGSKIVTIPWGPDNGHLVQTGGAMNGAADVVTYDMSGGDMGGTASIAVSDYFNLSGGATIESGATITKGDPRFDLGSIGYDDDDNPVYLDDGSLPSPIDTFAQSGGTMNGNVTTDDYDQSGGALGGSVVTGVYDLTSASATSTGATIAASSSFTLEPATGTATVDAKLTGTGKLTKSGGGTVILSNGANDFSGGVAVDAGTLDDVNDALPDNTAVTVAKDATLQLSIDDGVTTTFGGTITGADGTLVKDGAGTLDLTGPIVIAHLDIDDGTLHVANNALANTGAVSIAPSGTLQMTVDSGKTVLIENTLSGDGGTLVKDGAGTLTLGGNIYLGALDANAGTLNIGTGAVDATDMASFDSAVIASGATVYVAQGATLTIRIPNNIVNNGVLINDGTVNDDLDNNASFANNSTYTANVASNTGTIDNNSGGAWTGNVLTNAATINNNSGATWNGSVEGNNGTITNAVGGTWSGAVDNTGIITNKGHWTGQVTSNGSSAYPNTFMMIYNDKDAIWTGDVVSNHASIRNVAGTWNGAVDDNYTDIINDNSSTELDHGYWNGNVVANHNLIFNAGGGIWTGDVLSNNGTILSDRAAQHTMGSDDYSEWHGNVVGNAGTIESRAFWYGDVKGNAGTVANNGWWTGDVYAGNTGTIYNAEDDYGVPVYDKIRPTWTGKVNGNAGTILNIGGDWTGDVEANTGSISNTSGKYNGFQLGDSTWSGNVVSNAGTITNAAGSTWTGAVEANTGTINTAGTWTGNFSSAGTVNAQGTISGDFDNTGRLHLTGSLAGIVALTNDGTLDMGAGAANTLSAGSASFGVGSFYNVDVNSSGSADLLHVTGGAALAGTVHVVAMSGGDAYDDSTSFTILTADSGLGGSTFDGVTTNLAFLAPRLSYDTDDVYLMLKRNDVGFTDVGTTDNEKAAAAGAEALGAGNAIYDSLLWLDADQAQQAFDELAGEGYGATESTFVQNAGLFADIMTGRLDQQFDAVRDGDAGPSAYAATSSALAAVTPQVRQPETGIWGQVYGARGLLAANDETGGMTSATGGLAAGLDGLAGDWRLGMMLHAGATVMDMADFDASSRSADYGIGAYAGTQWGDTRLSLGADYSRHNVEARRDVAFPGFSDSLSASYAANTLEAFGKLSQRFDLGVVSLTPYAGLAYVRQQTDGFTESGGPAALSSEASFIDATSATLGLGADRRFAIGDGMLLTAKGGLGWRHAIGEAPDDFHSLAGGTSFSVIGAPIAGDTAVVNAGLNLDINANNTVDLSYDGQIGLGGQTHVVKAAWSGSF